MPDVIPPSRLDLEVGQSWEVGGCFDGFNISQFPSNCRAGVLASTASRSDSFSCWLWMSTQQWPASFHYYLCVLVSVVSGGDGNKHSCAITKRNRRISHYVVQIIIQWVSDGSLPRAFDHCPLPICWVCLMNLKCPFREFFFNSVQRQNINGLESNWRNMKTTLFSNSWNFESLHVFEVTDKVTDRQRKSKRKREIKRFQLLTK